MRTIIFFRAEGFYPTEYPANYSDWQAEAERNPGTIRIEDAHGKVLWPKSSIHAVDPEEGTPLASNGDAEMSSSDINSAEFRGLVEDVYGGPPADTNSGRGSEGLGLPDREVTVHSPALNPSNITPMGPVS